MGDKSKLKTGKLGANVMEQRELHKHFERLDKQINVKVMNIESQQKLIAKSFHERLKQSVIMAKTQENTIENFKSNRINVTHLRFRRLKTSLNKNDETRAVTPPPSLKLRQWNKNFRVPYLKEYSFRPGIHTKPSKVLEVRCKMWEKVADFCTYGRERARSAPPRIGEQRPPKHIERAHTHALELVGIPKWLVQKPSSQPLIDQSKVTKWREKERQLASGAVEEFTGTLSPYRLKPGPSQRVLDTNSLYRILSAPAPAAPPPAKLFLGLKKTNTPSFLGLKKKNHVEKSNCCPDICSYKKTSMPPLQFTNGHYLICN